MLRTVVRTIITGDATVNGSRFHRLLCRWWTETVNAEGRTFSDEFGSGVALSANHAVVAANQDSTGGSNAGALHVFKITRRVFDTHNNKVNGEWVHTTAGDDAVWEAEWEWRAKLTANDAGSSYRLGTGIESGAVAITELSESVVTGSSDPVSYVWGVNTRAMRRRVVLRPALQVSQSPPICPLPHPVSPPRSLASCRMIVSTGDSNLHSTHRRWVIRWC